MQTSEGSELQTQACRICSISAWLFSTCLNTKHILIDNYSLSTEILPYKTKQWMKQNCYCELCGKIFKYHLVRVFKKSKTSI